MIFFSFSFLLRKIFKYIGVSWLKNNETLNLSRDIKKETKNKLQQMKKKIIKFFK